MLRSLPRNYRMSFLVLEDQVSPSKTQTYRKRLDEALKEAGLPADITSVVGKQFVFGCHHGSHRTILSGTVTGIQLSDEGGLKLYVSTPNFWGCRLDSLAKLDAGWAARVLILPEILTHETSPKVRIHAQYEYYPGVLEFIP